MDTEKAREFSFLVVCVQRQGKITISFDHCCLVLINGDLLIGTAGLDFNKFIQGTLFLSMRYG